MNMFNNLDPEQLIAAVRARRILYDRYDKLFHRHKLKNDIWYEVCDLLNRNFSTMSQLQKADYSREIQKRWKNLRTCFTRELCVQKKEQLARKKNLMIKKRKTYEHYHQPVFLKDCIEGAEGGNYTNNGNKDNESVYSNNMLIEDVPVEYSETRTDLRSDTLAPRDTNGDNIMESDSELQIHETNVRERMLDMIEDAYKDDDDSQFVLSLIPMFKELDDEKKLEARIDVMGVLQEFMMGDCIQNKFNL